MARGWDLLFVALAAGHAAVVLAVPATPIIAVGVWWNSNTIAHNFIHRPFFRGRSFNSLFSVFESVLLGFPQALWRERHLAHHADRSWQPVWSRQLALEASVICGLWVVLAWTQPRFFLTVYLPGYLAGLGLCALQGHYEHAGATTSHYGRIYNVLCFNDGYHVEHHVYPGVHWSALPGRLAPDARISRWPALLRWIDGINLDALERLVLRSRRLQRFVVNRHLHAFRALLPEAQTLRRVAVVGGGLFPRTALVLRQLIPTAEIVVIDASLRNLETARQLVGAGVTFEHGWFAAADPPRDFDLVVIPLAFQGDREAVYRRPPAPLLLVHDWLWRARGQSAIVSWPLLKRLNLVKYGEYGELTRPRIRKRRHGAAAAAVRNATSLFVVFALAKAAILWGRPIDWSPSALVAYFWQDVAVALAFGVVTLAWARALVLYGVLAMYAALNVPITRVLSTPLTWPMWRATSGTLADSILMYATVTNVLLVVGTCGVAVVLPRLFGAPGRRVRLLACAGALLVVAVGPLFTRGVDTMGLHRNALVAFGSSLLPRVDALEAREEWTSPVDVSADGSSLRDVGALAHLRGLAMGRNVVLVSLESTAAQYLPLYGAVENVTPHLDALARTAVVFDNAYAAYPESIKGLFSMLCSTYPAFDTTPDAYAGAPCRSIAGILSHAGYRTGLFHSGRFGYLGMEAIVRNRGYETLEDAGDIGGNHESSFGVDEPATVQRMLAWIDALPPERRFFLTYLPIAGHHPYETLEPGPFPGRDELGRYRNALHYADRALGSLVDGLRARGLEDDTVWVIVGDHGEAMGQHEANYGHTFFLYEENVRVPFVVAVPGALSHMKRSRTIVSLVDTAPTILDVLGLPLAAEFQGRSTFDSGRRMALFFTDYSLGLLGLRDGRWKFVHELDSGRSKLFDVESDPGERVDRAADHRPLAAAYEQRLRAWSAAQKSFLTNQRVE
jgi:arylsulfatase A-like enzyme